MGGSLFRSQLFKKGDSAVQHIKIALQLMRDEYG